MVKGGSNLTKPFLQFMENAKSHKPNKQTLKNSTLSCSKSGNEKATYFCWKRHLLVAVIHIYESTQFQPCNSQMWSKVDSIELNHYFNSWKVQSHINKINKLSKNNSIIVVTIKPVIYATKGNYWLR